MMKKQKNANKREIKRLCVFFLFFFSEKERRVFQRLRKLLSVLPLRLQHTKTIGIVPELCHESFCVCLEIAKVRKRGFGWTYKQGGLGAYKRSKKIVSSTTRC